MSKENLFIATACFISLFGYMGASVYIAAFVDLGQVFHVTPSFIKFSITVYYVGLVVGAILSGPLSEGYGRKRALIFFLALFSGSSLLCALAPSIEWFLGGRLVEGIGNAGGPVLVMAIVADRYEGDAYRKAISYLLVVTSLGPGISPIVGSSLLYFFEWRIIFYLLAVFGVLALGLICRTIDADVKKREKSATFREYLVFIKDPFFRYYCLMIGALYGAFYTFMVVSPYIFYLHYGWRSIDFAWVGLGLAFANSVGTIMSEEFVRYMKSKGVLLIGIMIIAASLLLFSLIGLPPLGAWFLLIATLFAIGQNLTTSCLTADAMKRIPQFSNVASSLLRLSRDSAVALTLCIVPFLSETLAVINFFILIALVLSILGYLRLLHSF